MTTKEFVEKIERSIKNYEEMIIPYRSYSFCKETLERLKEEKEIPHDALLAEFIINFKNLWEGSYGKQ